MAAPNHFDTHEVTNQSPPFADIDLFAVDLPLRDAVRANGAWASAAAPLARTASRNGRSTANRSMSAKGGDWFVTS